MEHEDKNHVLTKQLWAGGDFPCLIKIGQHAMCAGYNIVWHCMWSCGDTTPTLPKPQPLMETALNPLPLLPMPLESIRG